MDARPEATRTAADQQADAAQSPGLSATGATGWGGAAGIPTEAGRDARPRPHDRGEPAERQQREGSQEQTGATHRLPAEWEPHAATWLIWPGHSRMVPHWHGHETALRGFYQHLLAAMGRFEQVHLLVGDDMVPPPEPRDIGTAPIDLVRIASDDIWLRDTAPTFLIPRHTQAGASDPARLMAVCGQWRAYGGKYDPSHQDARLAERLADHLHCLQVDLPLVLEGGAFDGDGAGTLIASHRSIVCEKRNPGLSGPMVEGWLRSHLDAREVIWIDACLQGDDTDGHVDQLVRFVAPGRVLVAQQPDPSDEDHAMLQRLQDQLRSCRDARGRALEIIPVDLPPAQYNGERRVPASHLNFYIGNRAVYVPCFGAASDAAAIAILRSCFPDRTMVPIDCRVLIQGSGALHCITRQQPALPAASQPAAATAF